MFTQSRVRKANGGPAPPLRLLINHEVKTEIVHKMKEEIQGFFGSPFEEKKSLSQVPGDVEGYEQVFVLSDDQKLEWADMFFLATLPVN
ncbi:S-norcoclaurine synthase 1 [Nymphaea thermarum]|nr:S-norcoclaurine synthase 1 [Nymphaea thermarum]